MTSPVTQTLIEQLRRLILNHTIVLWLDKDGHYTELVDRLADDGPEQIGARVLAYRGSYLELMRRLAPLTDGIDPVPLLVHVPEGNQESIKRTPLLELNDTGYQFRKALETLIREAAAGRVTPDEVEQFLARGQVSLASADAWMAQRVAAADDATTILLRGTSPGRLIHDLESGSPLAQALGVGPLDAVWHYFATQTGLPDHWPTAERRAWARIEGPESNAMEAPEQRAASAEQRASERKRRLADIAAAWVLCVEYVHDLKRAPDPKATMLAPAPELAKPLVEACQAAAEYLRESSRGYYTKLADDVGDWIEAERNSGEPDELGRIDTFRFEEDRLLVAALQHVQSGSWAQASTWATQRLAGKSIWLELDSARRKAWELIQLAARLGGAIGEDKLELASARNIDEATRRYAEHGAAIDRLHREFEERVDRDLVFGQLPHFELVRRAVQATRARWHEWADRAARQWSTLCEDEGPLPDASLQQRTVFEQVIKPLLDDRERTALFLVDALRYEMAQQLLELIGSPPATTVHLSARLAELPTETKVGMNALAAAVVRGSLHPVLDKPRRRIEGFDSGELQVRSRSHRETSLARRAGGQQCKAFEIEDLVAASDSSIRQSISKSRLVLVHSVMIDKAGESGAGLGKFGSELHQIKEAWQRLRAAEVRRFVFTSDHGFLLRRSGDDEPLDHGKFHDALARYAIYPDAFNDQERLGLSLRSLGYEGASEALILPRGLQVFQSGRDRTFVHGGNSPQERVIPVLTVQHKQAVGGEEQHYRVKISHETGGPSSHELSAELVRADNQTTLALDVEPIELELRTAEGVGVVAEVYECEHATLHAGLITARLGQPFTVRFRLSSAQEQRVRVELFSASARRRVDAATSQQRFTALAPTVSSAFPTEPSAEQAREPVAVEPVAAASWLDEFDDASVRRVLAHITQHGQIAEADLQRLLGPRKARKFAREFDTLYRVRAPFLMELAHGPSGKVYRKVTDK